ncbi:MAG: glycosyltransferase family 4 protein [Acidobacteriaceae bacterium]|jgi:glycosyltransferase involved in cell wall biosynthesis|nr:glycosyltransferase family 4 protein [Acidobacteriaceae bacterium]
MGRFVTGRPIRIAHVTTIDLSLRYLLLNQLRYLQTLGYEVTGVSASGPDVPELIAAGIRHVAVPMTRRMTPLADLRALWQLTMLFRRERFDIVHTHNPKPGLVGQIAARLAGVPIVVNTIHGLYFHERSPWLRRTVFSTFERVAAFCSDRILSQSAEDVTTLVSLGICRADRIRHLGNGIDISRFRPGTVDSAAIAQARAEFDLGSGPVVGFVGRLVAEKGLPELLAAAAIVRKQIPDVRFLIVGPADESKADALSPRSADEAGVGDICRFVGMRNDMPLMCALMRLFVLPSHREGVPRSPMEASAMGVPCIVTDVRGCREVVQHERTGLLVPVRDPEALAAAIVRLLTHEADADEYGRNARDLAERQFDERRIFATVAEEYARLTERLTRSSASALPEAR